MSPDRWNRVQNLFHEALETANPADRLAAEPDAELRRAAERLLAAHDEAGSFIEHPALDDLEGADAQRGEEKTFAGERVGPWQIVRRVGQGGMGDVFLAERADGAYQQRAALKLVRRGMDSDAVLARFRQERQILAGLDHPSVARLLDGGVAEGGPFDGQPYFAMEFVQGEPITAYCDRRRLPIPERLRLWAEVGEAVAAAHRRLVVHRDLKPSNVLVAEDASGEPHAKLLDFGIAKLLADDESGGDGAAVLTRTGARVLTPAYAAPEQVRGEAVTTATDVYGLGAVLYELLTGRRPIATVGRSVREIEQAVLNTEPERPSTAVTSAGGSGTAASSTDATQLESEAATPTAVAAARQTDVSRLQKTLAGDLDAVCLKALRKEPDARYAGADQFVEDVKRYLEGLPVAARRGSRAYRVRKFAERHSGALATAALLLVLIAGFGVLYTVRITAERNQSEAVTSFLEDVLSSADPGAVTDFAGDADLPARAIFDRAAERIGREFRAQPEVRGRLSSVIGIAYKTLGDYDKAEEHYGQAVEAYREAGAYPSPEVAEVLTRLANAYRDAGDTEAARAQYEEAIAMHREMGSAPLTLAVAQSQFGSYLWFYEGDMEEADSLLSASVAAFRRDPPSDLEGMNNHGVALNAYANLLHRRGDYDEAAILYEKNLDLLEQIRERKPGSLGMTYGVGLSNYADLQRFRGRLIEAEELELRALAVHRESQGDRSLDAVLSQAKLGRTYHDQGRYAKSDSILRVARPLMAELVPDNHPYMAILRLSALPPQREMGRLADVRSELDALGPLYQEVFPAGHPAFADLFVERSRTALAEGKPEHAVELAREGLAILTGSGSDRGIRAAYLYTQLGESLRATGNEREAREALRAGYELFVELQGTDSRATRWVSRLL